MSDIIAPFTYSGLPAPVAAEIEAATTRIKDRLSRLVPDILETGRDLQEVKGKLQHGRFERWLTQEFDMTNRTARRFMQAATWAEGKTDMVSDLTPNTIYLLSAPSTPESVQQQVLDDLEDGKPVNHREVREVVQEAKDEERKVAIARHPKLVMRKYLVGLELAREVADILVAKLSEDEVAKVYKALCDSNLTRQGLVEAITEAMGETHHSHGDTVVVFPPKPWAKP